jgi:hypothetical protein
VTGVQLHVREKVSAVMDNVRHGDCTAIGEVSDDTAAVKLDAPAMTPLRCKL